MYDNPKNIKENRINARFDDFEMQEIESVAILAGLQKGTFLRQAALKVAAEIKEELKREMSFMEEAV